jgi:hypothetical protein
MSRQVKCPNCGGEHALANPGITMLVCDFCKTVVYWDADSVVKAGAQAILPEADTRLFMHATGKLLGKGFEVVGHLRYDYGRGNWDEWYLQLDDQGVAWLSEDERELSLEQAARIESGVPPAGALRPGQPVTIEGVAYSVREVGTATCIGGEGQLPFTIQPGERYPYADLASLDGTRFATLEYEAAGVHAFAGSVLAHEQLKLDDEPPPSTKGSQEGRNIRCPNCDASITLAAGREVKTVVCEYCGAQNELDGAEARVLGVNPQGFDPGFVFEIGEAGSFGGERYEVCGRMLYVDLEGYPTREYLLWNAARGYLWLAEENGHYLLFRPTQQAPAGNPFALATKQSITAGPTSFRFYEQGTVRLAYVDGALPWKATVGEPFRYADLIAPPQMLSVEADGDEVEYFYGQYLKAQDVWAAFAKKEKAPPSYGIHPAQPFERGPVANALIWIGLCFALVNLGLAIWSAGSNGKLLFERTFPAEEYLGEALSTPFDLGAAKVLALKIQAPLRDSWLALDAALVDSKEQVVEEMNADISYYSGVEGGESWSEGSNDATAYFKAPPPGSYKLILKASGGSGLAGPCTREPITVSLYQGPVLSRYFVIAFGLTFVFPFFGILRKRLFESRRWAPVVGDDDDDDDD